jgi:hypothetical protein
MDELIYELSEGITLKYLLEVSGLSDQDKIDP